MRIIDIFLFKLKRPINILYQFYKDADDYDLWKTIADEFRTHLPLRNLLWKSVNRPARSIQTLGIELKPFTLGNNEQSHMMPVTLLEKPYLNLYLVNCDVSNTARLVK